MRIFGIFASATAVVCLAFPAGAAEQLRISDIVNPPIDLSISGSYHAKPEKDFSIEVSPDRFIKSYSDGVTIIGVKEQDVPIYYVIDRNKKTVLKVSQANLYKIGRFFNWNAMTTLVDLPGETAVLAQDGDRSGCTLYRTAKAGVALCVDSASHLPLFMEQNGAVVAHITSIRPLSADLKAVSDSLMLACQREQYNFFDVDADMAPDAD